MKTKNELKQEVLTWAQSEFERIKGVLIDISSVQDEYQETIFFAGTIEELLADKTLSIEYNYGIKGDERGFSDFAELVESCSDEYFDTSTNPNYVELSNDEIKLVEQIFNELTETEVFGDK